MIYFNYAMPHFLVIHLQRGHHKTKSQIGKKFKEI